MSDLRLSTASVISPHAALEALTLADQNNTDALHSQAPSDPTPNPNLTPKANNNHPSTVPMPLNTEVDALSFPEQAELDEDVEEPMLVRARFDFKADDPSALSFREGDVIEVLTMLESGWWDGILGDRRGWFPSNYVEELDGVFDDHFIRPQPQHQPQAGPSSVTEANQDTSREFLSLEDSLAWNDDDWSSDALGELARGLMQRRANAQAAHSVNENNLSNPPSSVPIAEVVDDDPNGFEAAARARREGLQQRQARAAGLAAVVGNDDFEFNTMDEFGEFGVRNRRETEETIKALHGRDGGKTGMRPIVGPDDAWVPSLAPDGRVYYHNTQTGEDSWEIPLGLDDDDNRANYDVPTSSDSLGGVDSPYNTFTANRSGGLGTKTDARVGGSLDNAFRPPPKVQMDVPYPWIARMSDDGREWTYVNRLTNEVRRDPPKVSGRSGSGGDRRSAQSEVVVDLNEDASLNPNRQSVEVRRKLAEESESRLRTALAPIFTPLHEIPTMGLLLDNVYDAIREIFEAAVAGAAAEEEMSRAQDLQSQAGIASAISHDETARELLQTAHVKVVQTIRDLVSSFGYVGPLDRPVIDGSGDLPMSRPTWAGDMTLVGSMGLLAFNIHAASISCRETESGQPVWTEVMRSATKLKDVVGNLPKIILPDLSTPAEREAAKGRAIVAWFGIEGLGDFMSGRYGFGSPHTLVPNQAPTATRIFDQTSVVETQKIKAEFDASLRMTFDDDILLVIRCASHLRDTAISLDIASALDIDGDTINAAMITNSPTSAEDARVFADLVEQARKTLRNLDDGIGAINKTIAELVVACGGASGKVRSLRVGRIRGCRDALAAAVASTLRAISTLLVISQEQAAAVEQGVIRGQIGHRSAKYIHALASFAAGGKGAGVRPQSIISTASKNSNPNRNSRELRKGKARGLEEEFLDQYDPDDEGRDIPSEIHSASASQSSLVQQQQHQQQHQIQQGRRAGDLTASSSSASLTRDSDGSSIRGSNRSSILKAMPNFLRNRSVSDTDSGAFGGSSGPGSKGKSSNRKLAKLLGEDSFAMGVSPASGGVNIGPGASTSIPPSHLPMSAPSTNPSNSMTTGMSSMVSPGGDGAGWNGVSETPAYLAPDYGPDDIIFDDRGGVKAGTINALIERLTPHTSTDTAFFQAFLLTYRSYLTTEEMVNLLIQRYNITPPSNLTPDQLKEWSMRKQTPIRLRVANTLKAWLDHHYIEVEDKGVLDKVESFARTTLVANGSELLSKQLIQLVERRRRGEANAHDRRVVSGGMLSPPAPLLPRATGRPLQLLDIHPLELARQLTIIESTNFQRIKPRELLKKNWQNEDNETTKAPHVRTSIGFANRMAGWLAGQILQYKDVKQRATMLKYIIKVAVECHRSLNNFSTAASMIAAVNSAPITRLKRTWEILPEKTLRDHHELDVLMDSTKNFANYRERLKTINPPCVPFLGFYLSAMIFIEDGNKDYYNPPPPGTSNLPRSASSATLPQSISSSSLSRIAATPASAPTIGDGPSASSSSATTNATNSTSTTLATTVSPSQPLINFYKFALAAETLRDVQQYQSQPYNLAVCKPIQRYIEIGVENVASPDELYELSLIIEPKERDDERITRMLHDSGFI